MCQGAKESSDIVTMSLSVVDFRPGDRRACPGPFGSLPGTRPELASEFSQRSPRKKAPLLQATGTTLTRVCLNHPTQVQDTLSEPTSTQEERANVSTDSPGAQGVRHKTVAASGLWRPHPPENLGLCPPCCASDWLAQGQAETAMSISLHQTTSQEPRTGTQGVEIG